MLELITNLITNGMDYLLGWILFLPRDLMLFMVAVMTSAILAGVRIFSTDQDWLRRADADKKRLAELLREAKRHYHHERRKASTPEQRQAAKARYKDAKTRHKATLMMVKMKATKFEGKPFLYAIIPIALLATWAFGRLGFLPPKVGEPVAVKAYFPNASIGRVVHMTPQDGLEVENGWVQKVVKDQAPPVEGWWDKAGVHVRGGSRWAFNKVVWFLNTVSFGKLQLAEATDQGPALEGVAVWKLKARKAGQHTLTFVYEGQTYNKSFEVGTRHYAPAMELGREDGVQAMSLAMKPVKLFDQIGSIDWLFLDPWIVAYLLIAIPFVTILKRLFRVQ